MEGKTINNNILIVVTCQHNLYNIIISRTEKSLKNYQKFTEIRICAHTGNGKTSDFRTDKGNRFIELQR